MMSMPTPIDDRSVPCKVAQMSARQIWWRSLGIPSFARDPIVKKEQKKTLVLEVLIGFIGFAIGWFAWGIGISSFTLRHLGSAFDLLAQMVFSTLIYYVFWYLFLNWIRSYRFHKIASIYLQRGCCPSCGYILKGLNPETDSCVLCPECNAAWKNERLGISEGDE
jgi:hypothetical protein